MKILIHNMISNIVVGCVSRELLEKIALNQPKNVK